MKNHLLKWSGKSHYPLVKLWKITIEIVDFPMKNGDFPLVYQMVNRATNCKKLPESTRNPYDW